MVAVPAGLPVGTVAGRFLFVSQDQADSDTAADYTVVSGTVKFTCSAKRALQVSSQDLVIVPREFYGEFDSDGYLIPVGGNPGVRGIELPASDSTVYNPSGFTWKVDFDLRDAVTGNAVKVDSFSMFVASGVVNQMSDQLPVSEAKGIVQIRGEQGTSLSNVTSSGPGLLMFAFEDNTSHTVDITNAVEAAYEAGASRLTDELVNDVLSDVNGVARSTLNNTILTQTAGKLDATSAASTYASKAAVDAITNTGTGGIGATSVAGGIVGAAYSTGYGVTAAGAPYFDTAGASIGEEAILTPDPASTSGLSLVKIGG